MFERKALSCNAFHVHKNSCIDNISFSSVLVLWRSVLHALYCHQNPVSEISWSFGDTELPPPLHALQELTPQDQKCGSQVEEFYLQIDSPRHALDPGLVQNVTCVEET